MRRACALALAAAAAWADPVAEVRRALYGGDAATVVARLDAHGAALAADPHLARMVCGLAADLVPRLRRKDADLLIGRIARVASAAADRVRSHVHAEWAGHEAVVFRERMRYRNGRVDALAFAKAAREISRLLERGRRAEAGYTRAIDLLLEGAAHKGGNWFAAVGGLVYVRAKMKHHEVPDWLHASVEAAVAMEEARYALIGSKPEPAKAEVKLRSGLRFLAPHLEGADKPLFAVARHNDLVDVAALAPELGVKADYVLAPRRAGALRYAVPLSRAWRFLPAAEGESLWQLRPDGTARREMRVVVYEAGRRYGKLKGADVKGIARRDLLAAQRALTGARKKRGPRASALNERIAQCLESEVTGRDAAGAYRRHRGFYFATKSHTYAVRITEHEDSGDGPDPALDLVLESISLQG